MSQAAEATGSLDVEQFAAELDGETRDMLSLLAEGERNTSTIREETGMSRQKVNRRLDRLEERGVVSNEIKPPEAGGQPQRHARLTDRGEEAIEADLLEKIHDTNTNIGHVRDRIDAIEQRLDHAATTEYVDENLERRFRLDFKRLERNIETLESDVERAQRTAEDARKATGRRAGEAEERVESVASRLDDRFDALDSRLDSLEAAGGTLDDLDAETRLRGLDRSVRLLFARVTAVENILAELAEEQGHLSERVRDLEAEADRREERLTELAEGQRQLVSAIEDLQGDVSGLDTALGETDGQASRAARRADRNAAEIEEVRAELEAVGEGTQDGGGLGGFLGN